MKAGGHRAVVAEVLTKIARKLVGEYGMTLAEVARNIGVLTTAISNKSFLNEAEKQKRNTLCCYH